MVFYGALRKGERRCDSWCSDLAKDEKLNCRESFALENALLSLQYSETTPTTALRVGPYAVFGCEHKKIVTTKCVRVCVFVYFGSVLIFFLFYFFTFH
jgi:hypothetical protein